MHLTGLDHPRTCTLLSHRTWPAAKVGQRASTLATLELPQTRIPSHNPTITTIHRPSRSIRHMTKAHQPLLRTTDRPVPPRTNATDKDTSRSEQQATKRILNRPYKHRMHLIHPSPQRTAISRRLLPSSLLPHTQRLKPKYHLSR